MKKLIWVSLLMVICSLINCSKKESNVIKIGLIVPITGDVKTFGESVRNSVLLAVEEINQKGGINGKQVKIITADDKNDPTEASNAASKLINQDKVKFIIGSVASKSSIPLSEICQQAKVLMITPTSTNPKVTVRDNGERKDFVFRACFIDPFQGTVAAKFAVEQLNAKKAAVLYDKSNAVSYTHL
ncbi:MAG: ABC transporter substrate-binding protein, partial [candidate division WOR-3 bacterium]|nr:ABC transporter substrate-binding protein [candidate division WOR-3 bacterium]